MPRRGNDGELAIDPRFRNKRQLQRVLSRMVDPNGPIAAATPVPATTATAGIAKQATAISDASMYDITELQDRFNALLAALRAAGVLET